MIDFRYHLVSLVAVFLALAVGIILGAGPLADPIGDTLTGQVDKLREDRNQLNEQLTQAQSEINVQDQTIEQFAPRIFNGFLQGVPVALVVLPDAEAEDVKAVNDIIATAGGSVSAQINLQDNFFAPAKQAYREALSSQLRQYLSDATRATTPESTLAAAIGQLVFMGQNDSLSGILTVEETPLIQVANPASQPARAAIIVGSGPVEPQNEKQLKALENRTKNLIEFAQTLNTFASGVVLYGSAQGENDLLTKVRSGGNPVPTVDSIGTKTSLISLPFALVARMNGTVGAWGSEQNASALVPPFTEVPALPAPVEDPGTTPTSPAPQ